MSRESLAALTRGIHHAASSTYALLSQQYMHMMMQFFDENEDGMLVAKMTYVQVDDKNWIPIPLISLVAPKGLALERMKVALSVRIEETDLKQATIDNDGSDIDRLSFKVTASPKSRKGERRASDVTDIEMEFNAGDPPEAVMRMIDSFTNLIDPRSFDILKPPTDKWPPTPIKHTGIKLKRNAGPEGGGESNKEKK